jgi:hypothetical protein
LEVSEVQGVPKAERLRMMQAEYSLDAIHYPPTAPAPEVAAAAEVDEDDEAIYGPPEPPVLRETEVVVPDDDTEGLESPDFEPMHHMRSASERTTDDSSLPSPPPPVVVVDEEEPHVNGNGKATVTVGPPLTAEELAGNLGRESPMRYVHGLPLHNVAEDEEFEE